MADGLRRRQHIATQWQKIGGGSVLRCYCGEWESDPSDTAKAQREAHQAHRREMGEHVAPRRSSVAERLHAAEAANGRAKALHSRDDSSSHGPWCGTCMTSWPCRTWIALDVPADGEQTETPEEGPR